MSYDNIMTSDFLKLIITRWMFFVETIFLKNLFINFFFFENAIVLVPMNKAKSDYCHLIQNLFYFIYKSIIMKENVWSKMNIN